MVEEGRGPNNAVVKMVVQEYLGPLKEHDLGVLLLGCTHYPLLREAFAEAMGSEVAIIDSAYHTAEQVGELISKMVPEDSKPADTATVHCYVTDNPDRFASLGTKFLREPLGQVTYVPLDTLIGEELGGALGFLVSGKAKTSVDGIAKTELTGNRAESGGVG
jgi:glutamate racemase